MAADTLVTCQGQLLAKRPKVHRLKDGRIVGASGPSTCCQKLVRWLEEGGEQPSLSDDVAAIILNPDGTIDWIDCKFELMKGCIVPYALGCGDDIALGAMLAGATPEEAVKITASRRLDIGDEATVISLPETAVRAVA